MSLQYSCSGCWQITSENQLLTTVHTCVTQQYLPVSVSVCLSIKNLFMAKELWPSVHYIKYFYILASEYNHYSENSKVSKTCQKFHSESFDCLITLQCNLSLSFVMITCQLHINVVRDFDLQWTQSKQTAVLAWFSADWYVLIPQNTLNFRLPKVCPSVGCQIAWFGLGPFSARMTQRQCRTKCSFTCFLTSLVGWLVCSLLAFS